MCETMNLESLGHAAATFQQDPRILEVALRAVGVPKPSLRLNNVAYYETDSIIEGIKWLAENDARDAANKAAKEAADHAE